MVEANKDPDTRCIVLTGAGRGFCSGLDLIAVGEGGIGSGEAVPKGQNRPRQLFDLRDAPINVMWNIDTPVVCAVNGAAAGYGMDITLLADIRIAGESAKMAAVTAKRNVVPESGGTWLLPRLIGWAKAAELYYRARTIDAQEALDLGLFNAVVPNEELMDTAMQWANEIADILNWFPGSVRVILRTFNRDGLDALRPRKRPGPTPLVKRLSEETLHQLKDLAHQSPRNYGVDRAVWRSADLAEVAFEEGILSFKVHPLRLRRLFQSLGYSWKLVKAWQISPDPDYAEKKRDSIDS
jgi:enoyl-CoA hydratase/carnithine racemase